MKKLLILMLLAILVFFAQSSKAFPTGCQRKPKEVFVPLHFQGEYHLIVEETEPRIFEKLIIEVGKDYLLANEYPMGGQPQKRKDRITRIVKSDRRYLVIKLEGVEVAVSFYKEVTRGKNVFSYAMHPSYAAEWERGKRVFFEKVR